MLRSWAVALALALAPWPDEDKDTDEGAEENGLKWMVHERFEEKQLDQIQSGTKR